MRSCFFSSGIQTCLRTLISCFRCSAHSGLLCGCRERRGGQLENQELPTNSSRLIPRCLLRYRSEGFLVFSSLSVCVCVCFGRELLFTKFMKQKVFLLFMETLFSSVSLHQLSLSSPPPPPHLPVHINRFCLYQHFLCHCLLPYSNSCYYSLISLVAALAPHAAVGLILIQ